MRTSSLEFFLSRPEGVHLREAFFFASFFYDDLLTKTECIQRIALGRFRAQKLGSAGAAAPRSGARCRVLACHEPSGPVAARELARRLASCPVAARRSRWAAGRPELVVPPRRKQVVSELL